MIPESCIPNKNELLSLFKPIRFTNYSNRIHALITNEGNASFIYAWTKDTTKNLICQTSNPIMQIANMALQAFNPQLIESLNFTHCVITLYKKNQFVGLHTDEDNVCNHQCILSISFGADVEANFGGEPMRITNGQAVLFVGTKPHQVLPLKGVWRCNLSFRSWHK
jgi:hypothetical protein